MKIYKFEDVCMHLGHDFKDYFVITKSQSQNVKRKKKYYWRSLIKYQRLSGECLTEYMTNIQHWLSLDEKYGKTGEDVYFSGCPDFKTSSWILRAHLNSYVRTESISYGESRTIKDYVETRYGLFPSINAISKNFIIIAFTYHVGHKDTVEKILSLLNLNDLKDGLMSLEKGDTMIINRNTKNFNTLNLKLEPKNLVIAPNEETFAIMTQNEVSVVDLEEV